MEPPRGFEPRTYALRAAWPAGFPHESSSATAHFPHGAPATSASHRVISGLLSGFRIKVTEEVLTLDVKGCTHPDPLHQLIHGEFAISHKENIGITGDARGQMYRIPRRHSVALAEFTREIRNRWSDVEEGCLRLQ